MTNFPEIRSAELTDGHQGRARGSGVPSLQMPTYSRRAGSAAAEGQGVHCAGHVEKAPVLDLRIAEGPPNLLVIEEVVLDIMYTALDNTAAEKHSQDAAEDGN
jgi:hypothetical protein